MAAGEDQRDAAIDDDGPVTRIPVVDELDGRGSGRTSDFASDARADQQAQPQGDVQADARADQQAQPQGDVQADARADQQAQPQGDVQADARADQQAQPQGDVQADARADQQAQPQGDVQARPQARPKADEIADELAALLARGEGRQLPAKRDEPPRDPRRSDVDEWGRSEHMRSIARRVYAPIYDKWFRAEWDGLEKIPTDGGALLVANHAAAIPSDAPAIMHGIETELDRPVYGLADTLFKGMPVVGTLWARLGGVVAHPDNAYRLLREQGQLTLVFPEGSKGPAKHYSDRYQLRRFGRGGFVEIAMRAGVPIIPIAVLGAEESMPTIYNNGALAKLLGLPYCPITANMLAFGPLGPLVYFPAKFKLKVLDPITFDVEADQERYSRSRIMDESERIRETIQGALYEMLRERQSVWFG